MIFSVGEQDEHAVAFFGVLEGINCFANGCADCCTLHGNGAGIDGVENVQGNAVVKRQWALYERHSREGDNADTLAAEAIQQAA